MRKQVKNWVRGGRMNQVPKKQTLKMTPQRPQKFLQENKLNHLKSSIDRHPKFQWEVEVTEKTSWWWRWLNLTIFQLLSAKRETTHALYNLTGRKIWVHEGKIPSRSKYWFLSWVFNRSKVKVVTLTNRKAPVLLSQLPLKGWIHWWFLPNSAMFSQPSQKELLVPFQR